MRALAPPEFRTTARSCPLATASRDHLTGAATTRLRVNTPAAAEQGPRLATTARSRRPLTAADASGEPRIPGGGDTHGGDSDHAEAGGLIETKGEVRLDWMAPRRYP